MKGAVHFSRDVIFNEELSGHLGILCPTASDPVSPSPVLVRPVRDRMLTAAGCNYQAILQLKELRRIERSKRMAARTQSVAQNGGANSNVDAVVVDVVVNGGETVACGAVDGDDVPSTSIADLTWSGDLLADFLSFLASLIFPDQLETDSLMCHELQVLS